MNFIKLLLLIIFSLEITAVVVCDLSYSKISDEDKCRMTRALHSEMPEEFLLVDSPVSSVCSIIEKLKGEIEGRDVDALTLSGNLIRDKTFHGITDALKKTTFPSKISVLDLSNNTLTPDSFDDLLYWAQQDNIKYIDISSNTKLCNKKFIEFLLTKVKESGEDPIEFSRKFIYLRKPYIYQAGTTVQIYTKAVKDGLLDETWYEVHKRYYKSNIKRSLNKFCYDVYTEEENSLNLEGYESIQNGKTEHLIRNLNEMDLSILTSSFSSLEL